jgi:hypothetical protein
METHFSKPGQTNLMKHLSRPRILSASFLASLIGIGVNAAPGDYSPTTAARPSPGLLNEYLRQNDPYMAAWDLGVAARLRYEVKDNFAVPGSPGSLDFRDHGANEHNDYLLYRIRPRVGYADSWYSVMVEGRHSGSIGDERNPNPDDDSMDLHQAYLTLGNHKEFPVSLKIGRQEMVYGDERLIGASAFTNLGRTFDAAKLRWQNEWFSADLFTSRVVVPDNHNFNESNDYDWFSGIYATTKKIPIQTTDIYFLSRNANAQAINFQTGGIGALPSARDIYTYGIRMKSNPGDLGNWDYNTELMGQFGHFNDPLLAAGQQSLSHEAYAAVAGFGYTWTQADYTPRVGLEYSFGSGDNDPKDGRHTTFENLFPTNHKFYGFMDFISLQNIHDIRFLNSIKPLPRLTLLAEGHGFWLADTHDSFYNVAGSRRGGIGSTSSGVAAGTNYGINPGYSSYVGSELDLIASYALSPAAALEAGYGHFFAGDYIRQSLSSSAVGASDANWIYLQLNISF